MLKAGALWMVCVRDGWESGGEGAAGIFNGGRWVSSIG